MTENTLKQIVNADANTIQLKDYPNTGSNNYFTNLNDNTKIYDDTTKNHWNPYIHYRPGNGLPMDAVTMTELKGKYIDTAEELTLGGRRHRSTRKNSKKSGKRIYVRSHRIGITRYASANKSRKIRRRK